jgi:FkbM family methyltransferase
MKIYNIVEYWNKRDNPCSTKIDEITMNHINFLKTNITGCKTVMDFGPGYGRLFEVYKNVDKVVCVDVTEKHKEKLNKQSKKYCFDFEFLCKTDILSKFKYKDKHFDAVVTSEVLFHQTPNVIEKIMKELLRISQKVVVITLMNLNKNFDSYGSYKPSNKYCFNYDYYQICKRNNWNIRNEERVGNQLMFVYSDYFEFEYLNKKIKFLFDKDEYYMSKIIKSKKTFYELKYLEYLKDKNLLDHNSKVVDIGSYLGNHSIYFSKIIGCNWVYCFEPTLNSYRVLLDNLSINNISRKTCYPIGIASRNGYLSLKKINPLNPGANQYIYDSNGVECKKLDSILTERIDFIKIDVENMELEVLNGCQTIIKNYQPVLMVEVGKLNIKEMTKWMRVNKYKKIAKDVFKGNTWLLKNK